MCSVVCVKQFKPFWPGKLYLALLCNSPLLYKLLFQTIYVKESWLSQFVFDLTILVKKAEKDKRFTAGLHVDSFQKKKTQEMIAAGRNLPVSLKMCKNIYSIIYFLNTYGREEEGFYEFISSFLSLVCLCVFEFKHD